MQPTHHSYRSFDPHLVTPPRNSLESSQHGVTDLFTTSSLLSTSYSISPPQRPSSSYSPRSGSALSILISGSKKLIKVWLLGERDEMSYHCIRTISAHDSWVDCVCLIERPLSASSGDGENGDGTTERGSDSPISRLPVGNGDGIGVNSVDAGIGDVWVASGSDAVVKIFSLGRLVRRVQSLAKRLREQQRARRGRGRAQRRGKHVGSQASPLFTPTSESDVGLLSSSPKKRLRDVANPEIGGQSRARRRPRSRRRFLIKSPSEMTNSAAEAISGSDSTSASLGPTRTANSTATATSIAAAIDGITFDTDDDDVDSDDSNSDSDSDSIGDAVEEDALLSLRAMGISPMTPTIPMPMPIDLTSLDDSDLDRLELGLQFGGALDNGEDEDEEEEGEEGEGENVFGWDGLPSSDSRNRRRRRRHVSRNRSGTSRNRNRTRLRSRTRDRSRTDEDQRQEIRVEQLLRLDGIEEEADVSRKKTQPVLDDLGVAGWGLFESDLDPDEPTEMPVVRLLEGHTDDINALVPMSPKYLVSASDDQTVRVWNLEDGTCPVILRGHLGGVKCVLPLFPTSAVKNSEERMASQQHDFATHLLATGSDDGSIRMWDLNGSAPERQPVVPECVATLEGHSSTIWSVVSIVDDDSVLASASDDQTIRLWDLPSSSCLQELKGHEGAVFSLAFLPQRSPSRISDDRTAAGRYKGRGAVVIRGSSLSASQLPGPMYRLFKGDTETLSGVAGLPTLPIGEIVVMGRLASGSADQTIRIWDLCSGACLYTIVGGHMKNINTLRVIMPNLLASASNDKTIKLWTIAFEEDNGTEEPIPPPPTFPGTAQLPPWAPYRNDIHGHPVVRKVPSIGGSVIPGASECLTVYCRAVLRGHANGIFALGLLNCGDAEDRVRQKQAVVLQERLAFLTGQDEEGLNALLMAMMKDPEERPSSNVRGVGVVEDEDSEEEEEGEAEPVPEFFTLELQFGHPPVNLAGVLSGIQRHREEEVTATTTFKVFKSLFALNSELDLTGRDFIRFPGIPLGNVDDGVVLRMLFGLDGGDGLGLTPTGGTSPAGLGPSGGSFLDTRLSPFAKTRTKTSIAMDYFDLYLFFQTLKMKPFMYIICSLVSEKVRDLRVLLSLFGRSLRVFERPRPTIEPDEFMEDAVEDVSFRSVFTLNVFNILGQRFPEIVKNRVFLRYLDDVNYLADLMHFQPKPIEEHSDLNGFDLSEFGDLSLKELFERTLEHLYETKRYHNLVLKAQSEEGMQNFEVHREILVFRSNFFYRLFRFPGKEIRSIVRDGQNDLFIEFLSATDLHYLLEFIYLNRMDTNDSEVSFRLLEHAEMYFESALKDYLVNKINDIFTTAYYDNMFEGELLKTGHLINNLPDSLQNQFFEAWIPAFKTSRPIIANLIHQSMEVFRKEKSFLGTIQRLSENSLKKDRHLEEFRKREAEKQRRVDEMKKEMELLRQRVQEYERSLAEKDRAIQSLSSSVSSPLPSSSSSESHTQGGAFGFDSEPTERKEGC